MAIWGKLGVNTLYHGLGDTKSNFNSSATYLTSNEAMLKCQDHLWVELNLFERVLGALGIIWENCAKNSKLKAETHEKQFKALNSTFYIKGGSTQL